MGKTLTREQNLTMRLNASREMAERALLEAVQNRFDSGFGEFDDTINFLIELVAFLRLESAEKVKAVADNLIVDYNRALEKRKEATAACLSRVRNTLEAHEQFSYHNNTTLDHLNTVSKSDEWSVACAQVPFPSFPNP